MFNKLNDSKLKQSRDKFNHSTYEFCKAKKNSRLCKDKATLNKLWISTLKFAQNSKVQKCAARNSENNSSLST